MKGLLFTRACGMTMVWGDPAGFAVDWDWQRGLTGWELAGRLSEPRFDRKALEAPVAAVRKLSASGCGQAGLRRCVAGRWRAGGDGV